MKTTQNLEELVCGQKVICTRSLLWHWCRVWQAWWSCKYVYGI